MKTFTEIPAVDLQQINNYLDNYEILLDRKGYALSDLKILSQKRREEIFQEIETKMERSNEYNLSRILESFASKPISTSLRAEENEVIFKVRIPPYLRLFPLGIPKLNLRDIPFPKRKKKQIMPKRPRSVKPVRTVRTIADAQQPEIEPKAPQQVASERPVETTPIIQVSPDSEFYYKLKVDVSASRKFVENSYWKTHKFLNIILILSSLIMIGITIGVVVIQYLYTFNRDQYFTCYEYNCLFLDYMHIGDIEEILIYAAIGFAYVLGIYIFMKLVLGLMRWVLRQEVGKIIIKCQIPKLEHEIDKLGGTMKRLFYEGIITSELLEA